MLFPCQLVPLAGLNVLFHTRRKLAVMLFDHAHRRAHLSGQIVDDDAVVDQRERAVGVPQTVQGSILTELGAFEKPIEEF